MHTDILENCRNQYAMPIFYKNVDSYRQVNTKKVQNIFPTFLKMNWFYQFILSSAFFILVTFVHSSYCFIEKQYLICINTTSICFLTLMKIILTSFSYDCVIEIIFRENRLECYQSCILFLKLQGLPQKIRTWGNKTTNLKSLTK